VGSTPLVGGSDVDTLLFPDTDGVTSGTEVLEVSLFLVDISIYFLPVTNITVSINVLNCVVKVLS
jgi:hypothetical protein